MPFLTQRFGQGKVTAILTDSLWRWQLGPEAGKAKPYDRFWKQMISWLLPREESLDQMRLEIFAVHMRTPAVHAQILGARPQIRAVHAQTLGVHLQTLAVHMQTLAVHVKFSPYSSKFSP